MAEEAPPTTLPAAIATENASAQASASSSGDAEEPKISASFALKRGADEAEEMAQVQDDDARSPPRKKARRHLADGEKSAEDSNESVDEGEVDSEGISKENTSSQVDDRDSSPEPTTANNAPSGLRTSFATSVPKQLNPDMAMHTAIAPEERVQLIDGLRNAESMTVRPIKKREVWWTIPPIRADAIVCSSWVKAYESALDSWCAEFIAENRQTIDETGLSADILKTAFMQRLDDAVVSIPSNLKSTAKRQLRDPDLSRLQKFAVDFKPDPKKDAKRKARQEAKEAKKAARRQHASLPNSAPTTTHDSLSIGGDANDDLEEGERMETDTEADNETSGASQAISQEERDLRQRYYPGISFGSPFCIACTSLGHDSVSCPESKCKFCQEEHFIYQCPSRQRCGKCKQLGHSKSSCKEKLAIAPGEGFMECAFCQGQDHEEGDCTELWQTYRPKMGCTKKVKQLPIYCYCCGAQGHFGSDCGLADPKVPPSETWTTAYASLYLDNDSFELPIVDQNPPPPPPEDSKPIIPGRSIKPQSHIIFEESDDEVQDFLRAPAGSSGAPKSAKSIQIKSNISFGGAPASTAPPPPPPQQQQLPKRPVRPAAQKALAIINAPPPPPRQGTRRYPLRSGKQASKRGQQNNQQQPPLPPGPPPSNSGTSKKSGRGRGGFSNLGRRGRGRSGNNR